MTPFTSELMRLGTYKIELRQELYQTVSLDAALSENRPLFKKHVALSQKMGSLALVVKPVGATVFINNQYLNRDNKKSIPLPYGKHQIKIIKTGYHKHVSNIGIFSDRVFEKSVQLTPKSKRKALLMSAVFPGIGQMYFGLTSKGIGYSSIALGLVYYTMTFNNHFSENWDQYTVDLENYRNATSISEIEHAKELKDASYEEAIKYRNLTIGSMSVTGLFWLVNIWDAGHNFRQLNKNIEISANNPGTVMLTYKF